jgi:hypothetical protein
MTKMNRSRSGRPRIDLRSAIASGEISGKNVINPLSASSFVLMNDWSFKPITRLIALRMIARRVQLSTHSLETEPLAMHSRKARIKHRFAAAEFAVSNSASLLQTYSFALEYADKLFLASVFAYAAFLLAKPADSSHVTLSMPFHMVKLLHVQ